MKKILNPILLIAALAAVSFSASGTQLIINNGDCVLELASGQAVSIDPATGDIRATVTNLEECMGQIDPPVITSFNATSSVSAGGTIQLSWNTQNADSCQAVTTGVTNPLQGWTGSKAVPSGSQNVTAPSPASDTTYRARLECSNSGGTVGVTRTITVTTGSTPVTCPQRPAPQGLNRAARSIWGSSASNHGHFWNGTFIGNFPGSTNARQYYQEPGFYHAIQFNTGNLPAGLQGQVNAGEPQGTWSASVAPGARLVSFSECPGDFHPQPDNPGCLRKLTGLGSIAWGGTATGHAFRCALKPNTTYYMNIVYTNSPAGDPNPIWNCSGHKPNCGAALYSTHEPSPVWP